MKPPGLHRPRGVYGAGSVRQLAPNKYEARAYVGRHPATGKPVYVSRIGKTAGEAQRRANAEVELRRSAGRPTGAVMRDPTIGDAVANYANHLDARVSNGDLAPSSRVPLLYAEQRLEPVFGVPLAQVTPSWVEAWSAGLQHSASTRRKTWDHLRNAIRLARRDGLFIGADPFDTVETKPVPTRNKEPRHATAAQVAAVLAAAPTDSWRAFFTVLAYTGMRTQEARLLTWGAVDWGEGTVTVTRGTTKSEAGHRVVPMLPEVRAALEAHRASTRWPTGDTDPVFVGDRTGRVLAYAMPGKVLARIAPGLNPHAFRHGAVTRMLEAGVSAKVVAETVGHADAGFTLRTYAHAVLEARKDGLGVLSGEANMG